MSSRGAVGILVLPPRLTGSARRVAAAAEDRGLTTLQCPTFEVPAHVVATTAARYLHAGPSFADATADVLRIGLLEAPLDWLTTLPRDLTHRHIRAMTLHEAHRLRSPVFVKTPNDKRIAARVYTDGTRLPGADAVDAGTRVLVSDVVTYVAEFRLHVLDGRVHAASRYAQDGRLEVAAASPDALAFADDLLAHVGPTLPSAIVVDVGLDSDGRWSVVEANAAWASGSYAADADRVLDVVLRAAGPLSEVRSSDRAFLRRGDLRGPRT
ncbi:ATP-grasp domain-containing protein [Nocardioides marinquilinus]|uniref:ATP-grasp domain-containing protein n=1 Tax=Nocardioides marinquilinus TaxID=1210400 RepID=UPI0031EA968D